MGLNFQNKPSGQDGVNLEERDYATKTEMEKFSERYSVQAFNVEAGLENYFNALSSEALTEIINISCVCDSIGEGTGATTQADAWKYIVGQALNDAYGDVGIGMVPTYGLYGDTWDFTDGAWINGNNHGCAGLSKRVDSPATATLDFNGDGIDVVVEHEAFSGTFGVSVDGGTEVIFDASEEPYLPAVSHKIEGLVDGEHTVTVRNISDRIFLVGAYALKGNRGVRFNMVGRYATRLASHIIENSLYCELDFWQPKLSVIALLANDATDQLDLTTYMESTQTIIDRAKNYGDVMITAYGIHNPTKSPITEMNYADALKGLALKNNCGFVNIIDRWGNDGEVAMALGYINEEGSSDVHPTDAGHLDIANVHNVIMIP